MSMAIAASVLPLVPSLNAGDSSGLSVFAAFGVVARRRLPLGGKLRLALLAAMGDGSAFAVGFLVEIGLAMGGQR